MLLQIITALGSLLTILAYFVIGKKNRYGWLISISAFCFWIWQGILINSLFQIFSMLFMMGVAITNFVKWGKKKNEM